jgi:hypothetical protein
MKVYEARAAAAVQSSLPKVSRRGANGEPTSRRNSPRTDGSNPVPSSGESQAPKPTDFGSFAEFERVMIRANALRSRKIEAPASVPRQASEQHSLPG